MMIWGCGGVHVCMWVYTCVSMQMGPEVPSGVTPQELSALLSETRSLASLSGSQSECQAPVSACLPSVGIAGMTTMPAFFMWLLGLN